MRVFSSALPAALLFAGLLAACRHTPANAPADSAAFHSQRVGEARVTALLDGHVYLPRGEILAIPAMRRDALLDAQPRHETRAGLKTEVLAFVLAHGGEKILVDTGTADCFAAFNNTLGHVPAALRAAGVAASEISHVWLTHAHPDHACGLVNDKGERAYANATVWIAETELAFWQDDAKKAAFPPEFHFVFDQARAALAPYLAAQRVRTFKAGDTLPTGAKVVAAPGHTPGHSAFLHAAESAAPVLFWGDAMHFPAVQFAEPAAAYAHDADAATAAASRKALLQQAAEGQWLIAGAHLPFPGLGHVKQGEGSAAWQWHALDPSNTASLQPENPMSSKKILFVLTSHDRKGAAGDANAAPSGFYLSEVSHPHKVLSEAGYQIDFVSPRGGKTHVDGLDLSDPVNAAFWNDASLRGKTENTLSPAQVNPADYAAIFYAGGHATMWDFADNAELAAIAGRIYDAGGVVAAVCHGPAGLVNVRLGNGQYLVAGKEVAAFTNEEERAVGLFDSVPFLLADTLTQRGARHLPAGNFQPQVVTSERLVTGQNPASAYGVAEAMLPLLKPQH